MNKDTEYDKQQITDTLKNLEEAFINFHIMLKTNTSNQYSKIVIETVKFFVENPSRE